MGYNIIVPDAQPFDNVAGDHGYDNREESMHPIFYAFGPAFRRNLRSEPFRNVDLYPLMSRVLHLTPRATNGSFNNVKHILLESQGDSFSKVLGRQNSNHIAVDYFCLANLVIACLVLVLLTAVIFAAYACCRSQQRMLVESNSTRVEYHLLSNDAGTINGSIGSEDEDDKL